MVEIKLLDRYPRFKRAIKTLGWIGVNLFASIIVLFLYIIKPFKFIKIYRLIDFRIGHLAANTDLFLRRLQLNIIKKNGVSYLGIASTKPANEQLLKMFKRKLTIIQIPRGKLMNMFLDAIFSKKSVLRQSIFCQSLFSQSLSFLPFNSNEYYEFNNAERNLDFTASEEEKGKKLLEKMGIKDNSWFICFHSRDPAYLVDLTSEDYRDCDVKNYLEAARYIASQDGYAVRMGQVVRKKLPDLNNSRIIDYASNYRTDFGDIYLPAKCKFFLGSTAGLFLVPTIFHVPVAVTNFIPIHTTLREGDLFILKKIWSIKEERFLTFREMLLEWENALCSEYYTKAGLKVVENTAEEILDLAIEMNERLDGTFKTTEEDEELQNRFHSLIKPHHHCYGTPARIGTKFLRENKELLE